MVKRSFDLLTVDGTAGFNQFTFLDISSDAQLPVCTGFALGNDVLGILAVGNDLKIDNGTWTCGKEQSVAVSCGMPTILVKSLTVGGE